MPATAFDQMLQSNAPDDSSAVPKNDAEFKQEAGKQLKIAKGAETEREGLQKKEETLLSKPPINPYAPKQEDFQTPFSDKFSSAGMLVATLGSLFTRHSLTSAANSMAGVLNSYNTGDMTKYQEAYSKWKTDNENAMKMADWEKDNLKTISDLIDKKEKGADSTITLMAKAMGNPALENAVKSGQIQQYVDAHKENILKMQKSTGEFDLQQGLVQDKIDKFTEENGGKSPDKAQMHQFQEEAMKQMVQAKKGGASGGESNIDWGSLKSGDLVPGTGLTLDAIDQKVETLHNGGSYSDAGLSMRTTKNPQKDAVDDRLAEKYPNFNRVEAEVSLLADKAEARREGIISGSLKTAANLLDQSIPLLREASANIDQGNWTDLNSFENYFKTHSNDPNLIKFRVALQTSMNDYTALGVRNGQTSDHARTSTEKLVNDLMSKQGIDAFADQIEKEKSSVLKGVDVTRGKEENPSSGDIAYLKAHNDSSHKAAFDKHFGEGSSAKALGG